MAKRFTDTEKWKDPWFCGLKPMDRLFWLYLVDNCDHAGIWRVNWPLVNFYMPDYQFCVDNFNGRIIILNDDKWFIKKFVDFQYGFLNPLNRTHKSVLDILEKEGASKHLIRPLQGCKDKGTDKGLDKDKEIISQKHFETVWQIYPRKVGKKEALRHFKASVKTDQDLKDIETALKNYLASERVMKGFIQNASTWFNNWHDWVAYKEDVCPKCKNKGKYTSSTGYEITCSCPAGKR